MGVCEFTVGCAVAVAIVLAVVFILTKTTEMMRFGYLLIASAALWGVLWASGAVPPICELLP